MAKQVTIEDLNWLSGKGMWACLHVVHTSYLASFDEPYIEPQEITLEIWEEIAKSI